MIVHGRTHLQKILPLRECSQFWLARLITEHETLYLIFRDSEADIPNSHEVKGIGSER